MREEISMSSYPELDSTLDLIEASLIDPPTVESFSLVSDLFTDIEKMRVSADWNSKVSVADFARLSACETQFEQWKKSLVVPSPEMQTRRKSSMLIPAVQQEIGRKSSVESFDFDQVNWEAFPEPAETVINPVLNQSSEAPMQTMTEPARSSTSPFASSFSGNNFISSSTFPLKFKVKVDLPWSDVAPLILEGPSTEQQRRKKVEDVLVDSLASSCNLAKSRITVTVGFTTN